MEAEIIRTFPLFAGLSDQALAGLMAELEELHLPEGALLMDEGGRTERVYLLLEGEVAVYKEMGPGEERLLAVRKAGATLGEMSIFSDNRIHTATVRTRTPVHALMTTLPQFERLLHTQPEIAYSVLHMVSRRLQETDEHDIADLREKNRELTQAYQELKAAQQALIEKNKIEHELKLAADIQRSILPQALPLHHHLDFGALMIPARQVGGDFYDFIPLPNNQMGIVVGDVCDKGMPAAFYMALVYSAMRLEAVKQQSPGDTLRAVNRHLKEISQSGMYVTLVYGIYDLLEATFTYARAGHPYPLLLDRDHHPTELTGKRGQPLGMFWDVVLDEQTVAIPTGGTLLVFSDGLCETIESRDVPQEVGPFCSQLMAGRSFSAQELCETLWHAAGDAEEGNPPIADDFTVVAVRHRV